MNLPSYIHIFLLCLLIPYGIWAHWNKFDVTTETNCALNNVKLLSLLNLLCNTTQTTSLAVRDACYGCFFRAGNLINGPTQLSTLSDCAQIYLTDTEYEICATNLQDLVDGNRQVAKIAGNCYTGYCDFVQCVRRLNAQQLIATCYEESLGIRELEEDLDRVYFYTNITSCILAKSRCSPYNPITGEFQTNNIGTAKNGAILQNSKAATFYFNALQISPNSDIRIFSFPSTTSISDLFCARASPLQQSGFDTFNC